MSDVFIKRDDQKQAGFTVGVVLNRKSTKGLVGIEIEVEGTRLPKDDAPPPWAYHHDGSLRGQDNAEYVLSSPIGFEDVEKSLDILWKSFSAHKSTIDDSNRTSVHVHLNCQGFHFNRLTSLMALYFALEEILTEWCGEHRVGNLFCLRAKDAPAIVSQIKRFISTDGASVINDHHHYAGLNANALHKFGSLEFRSLRGVSDPRVAIDWIGILERLYTLSADFTDPRDICSLFSSEGPTAFFYNILGPKAAIVLAGIHMNEDEMKDSLYQGVRLAQDLCYCRDWNLFQSVELKNDPFGRDPKKIAKKLGGLGLDQSVLESALSQLGGYDSFNPYLNATAPAPSQWAMPAPSPVQQTWGTATHVSHVDEIINFGDE